MAVIPASEAKVHELAGVRFTALASPSRGSAETSVWQVEVPVGAGPGTPHELTREEVLVVVASPGRRPRAPPPARRSSRPIPGWATPAR